MSRENMIRAFAGTVNLIGLAIGYWVCPWGYLISAFVGLNLLQSAFTKFCPLEIVLKKLGVDCGCSDTPKTK